MGELLAAGADKEAKDKSGDNTALILASIHGHTLRPPTAQALLAASADKEVKNINTTHSVTDAMRHEHIVNKLCYLIFTTFTPKGKPKDDWHAGKRLCNEEKSLRFFRAEI